MLKSYIVTTTYVGNVNTGKILERLLFAFAALYRSDMFMISTKLMNCFQITDRFILSEGYTHRHFTEA